VEGETQLTEPKLPGAAGSLDRSAEMNDTQILTLIASLAAVAVAAGVAFAIRSRHKASRREALKQRLRNITFHDQAKANRLIEFERTELKRKGRPEESMEDLMQRAIKRWERDNASAAPLY
jgi:cation transport regulator ChaC